MILLPTPYFDLNTYQIGYQAHPSMCLTPDAFPDWLMEQQPLFVYEEPHAGIKMSAHVTTVQYEGGALPAHVKKEMLCFHMVEQSPFQLLLAGCAHVVSQMSFLLVSIPTAF